MPPPERPSAVWLDSWKAIAAYLRRDVTTVQRWEKREGMPVHRHVHASRGSVYALPEELDRWVQSRRARALEQELKSEASPAAEISSPAPAPAAETMQRPRTRITLLVGALGLAILAVVAWLVAARRTPAPTLTTNIRSLAVLPLRNLSGEPAQDYLADGVTEALIGRLSNIHDLRVISYTSVSHFKQPQISVPEIAKELRVDAVVEGSVMKEGDRLRVTAQLIRGTTDEHLWSETYDRQMRDALTLESDLAQSIADKVEVTVTGVEKARLRSVRPVAPEVYERYLMGRYSLDKGSRASDEESIKYFQEALQRDPTFAPAYLGMALATKNLGTIFDGLSPAETRPRVIQIARQALTLDPDLADAHVVLANTLQQQWRWAEAETEYRRALAISPNNARAEAEFSVWFSCQGRTDEAIARVQRARALDPYAVTGADVSWILFLAHRYDESIREAESSLALHPDNAADLMGLSFPLIAAYRADEAVPVLERALALSHGSPGVAGLLVHAYARAGRRADAFRVLADLRRRRQTSYVPAGAFVNAYLGLGDLEQTFFWMEQACREQSNILQFMKVHPQFDPIRGDPRFADLLRRVGVG